MSENVSLGGFRPNELQPAIFTGAADSTGPIGGANRPAPQPVSVRRVIYAGNRSTEPLRRPLDAAHTLSLDETIAQLTAYEAEFHDQRLPVHTLRVEQDCLIAGSQAYRLEGPGFLRLCGWLKAPADYLLRLRPDLRSRVLQFHLQETAPTRTCRVISRGGALVAIARADLHDLSCSDLLAAVREGIGDDQDALEVQGLHIEDEALRIDLVSPRLAEEVRRGDVIQGGIRVEHSLVGGQATTVVAYVLRLLCTNGLTHRECLGWRKAPRTRRLGADRPDARQLQAGQVSRLVAEVWSGLRMKLTTISQLQHERADVKQVEQFLRQARLYSGRLMGLLRGAWEEEGSEPTAFGWLNALTRLGTHSSELGGRQRRMLTRLAGVFAYRHMHLCPHCFSVLRTE